ncbi:MAG: hypothetical protein B6I31_04630 [Desulfobacteraceae bacterium 4572_19]|nr:MAG: hypothetical protein B6I31_04630 [Desulfobacteraceae bacterium 4572_19]
MKIFLIEQTDVGKVREINEDFAGSWYNKAIDANLYCVADGMGGYGSGDIASKIAVDSVIKDFALLQKDNLLPEKLIPFMFENVQNRLRQYKNKNSLSMFGTTLALLIFRNDSIVCANIGDTRVYSFYQDKLVCESHDHNFAQELLCTGQISEEQAKKHPRRHVLTQALTGEDSKVDPFFTLLPLDCNKTYLIATDGLYGMVDDPFIASILSSFKPEEAAEKLLERAKENGGVDNITFQIITFQR